jgi:ABC-type bacteriocin/lantibiotic exporter with double-glycine peptidase domain
MGMRKQTMFRWLMVVTKGYRFRLLLTAALGVTRVLLDLCLVYFCKQLVDIATGHSTDALTSYIFGLIVVIVFELFCSTLNSRMAELIEASLKNDIRLRIFNTLLHSRWDGRESFHSGDLLARLTEDVRMLSESLTKTLPSIIISGVQLIAAFAFLCYFSPALAFTLLFILPFFLVMGKVFFFRIRRYTASIRQKESLLQEHLQESLQHRILLLTLDYTYRALSEADKQQQSLYRHIYKRTNFTNYSRTVVLAGFETGYMATFLWGVFGLRDGTITFGLMTAYLQLASQIQRPILGLVQLIPSIVQSYTAASRLIQIESQPQEEDDAVSTDSERMSSLAGIRIINVTFTYKGKRKPILNKFDYEFAPGSRTAIMGETGAGKSTLLRLILALLKPQSGSIALYDATKEVPTSVGTRCNIVYVPQGNTLLSGTIRQNLLMGDAHATDEMLQKVLHTAAADFVYTLKDGLNTRCGERGSGLSEGQAQRIAIARGLLRKGAILLLDEISSSLDEETETRMMSRLVEEYPERTILIVTHRSHVADYCTRVLSIRSSAD